jgi:exodeoxyribonuclease VIII
MTHIMVDLETLSTLPNARILSIGAVKFAREHGVYSNFYCAVKVYLPVEQGNSIDADGFHISVDTMAWWSKQSEQARKVFNDPAALSIDTALDSFTTWALTGSEGDVRLWGNGASFDNVILSSAYRLRNKEQPWKFWNDRCYRTVKHMHAKTPLTRVGTHHNALDDAESQARHLLQMGITLA